MTRLIVLGIDGMDPCVFEKFQAELPNLSLIQKSGTFRHCDSVFPPDSIPAWVTIFTGEYPEQHGWLDNIDYEDIRRGAAVNKMCDLQGRTFWDQLGQAGKRVCVINPLLAYPVWPVNGVMASGPVFITGEKQIFPPELVASSELPELGGMTDFPGENALDSFLDATLQSTRDLGEFGLKLLDAEPWDLFFISFFSLDRLQHFLWRFSDTTDPLYPGHSTLEDAIARSYRTFDEIVGKFLERLGDDAGLIVMSDHGHGQRPTMLLNINEVLRQDGLLKTSDGKSNGFSVKKGVEVTKNTSMKLVAKVLGEDWLYRIGRLLPKRMRKALKKSSYLIDKDNSIAWVSEVGGGAAVGGVEINPRIDRRSQEYRDGAGKVMECIKKVRSASGDPIIQWTRLSEENSCYPDVVFELEQHFSVGRSLFCPILEENLRHRIISGGHRKQGVFFGYRCQELASQVHAVSDLAPQIISFVSRAA
jgi:predicted AlkP superfamily phosphohydrolase/phosphomutase